MKGDREKKRRRQKESQNECLLSYLQDYILGNISKPFRQWLGWYEGSFQEVGMNLSGTLEIRHHSWRVREF